MAHYFYDKFSIDIISNQESPLKTFLVGDAHRQSLWHLLVELGDIGGHRSF
ncbi:MAG: hypothetical protein AABY14_05035 [Nanoarchaeota archaeon]